MIDMHIFVAFLRYALILKLVIHIHAVNQQTTVFSTPIQSSLNHVYRSQTHVMQNT